MNNLEVAIAMYRKGSINKYTLEKELGSVLEGTVHVSDSKNTNTSFGIFVVPSAQSVEIEYFVDFEKLSNEFSDEQLIDILQKVRMNRIKLSRKIFAFAMENREIEKTFDTILGFLLDLYNSYKTLFAAEWLPDENNILEVISKLSVGEEVDKERLVLDGMIPVDLPEYIKERLISGYSIKFEKSDKEIPVSNLFYRIAIENISSTFGTRFHKELPYDYLPETNQ